MSKCLKESEPKFWSHAQDLNEDKRHWKRGRCWWHWVRGDGRRRAIELEWCAPTELWHLSIDVGDESDIKSGLGCGLFSLWLRVEGFIPYLWRPASGKTTGISIHDGAIWFDLWRDEFEWKTSHWTHWHFNPSDFFLGYPRYSTIPIETVETVVELPEACYPVTVERFISAWKRPRWPWAVRLERANLELSIPIPIPGRGENDWDCEDGAIGSMCTPAKSVNEAIAHLIASVERDRLRYGGRNWQP